MNKPIFFWEKIAFRIAVGLLLPILSSVYAVWAISSSYTKLSEQKDRLNSHWSAAKFSNQKAELSVSTVRLKAQGLIHDSQPFYPIVLQSALSELHDSLSQSHKEVDALAEENNISLDPELVRFFSDSGDLEQHLRKSVEQLRDVSRRHNPQSAKEVIKEVEAFSSNLGEILGRLRSATDSLAVQVSEKIAEKERSRGRFARFLLIFITLLGAASCIVVTSTVLAPARLVLNRFRDIASFGGDLSARIQNQNGGELGELAYWINIFLDQIQGLIGTISNASDIIRKTTDGVGTYTNKTSLSAAAINKSMVEQSMQMDDCTTSVSSMDDLVQATSDSTRQAASLSKVAMDRALQGGASVHETVEAMVKIEESAQKIEVLVSSINEIASQTNLLAINAAIEATKAGEHGKGFAVVAEEVRKLAERARKLTGEVNVLINESSSRVKAGVNLAQGAGNSLDGIIKDVEAVVSLIQRIAASASKQTESSANLLDGMRKVSESVRGNLYDMQEVTRAAEFTAVEVMKLEALVGQINDLVSQFRKAPATPDETINPSFDPETTGEIRTESTITMPGIPPPLPTLLPGADVQLEPDDESDVA